MPDDQPSAQPSPGGPPAQGPTAAPSQAPANPQQIMLAQMFQVLKRMAQENPAMSAGLEKAAQGIQEAQTALLTARRPEPATANPPL
jgi:hypothetical protein